MVQLQLSDKITTLAASTQISRLFLESVCIVVFIITDSPDVKPAWNEHKIEREVSRYLQIQCACSHTFHLHFFNMNLVCNNSYTYILYFKHNSV